MNSSLGLKSIKGLVLALLFAVPAFSPAAATASAKFSRSVVSADKSEKKKDKDKKKEKGKSKSDNSGSSSVAASKRAPIPLAAMVGSLEAVTATVETDPVPHGGDAADDPAIWVNPNDPAQSAVI